VVRYRWLAAFQARKAENWRQHAVAGNAAILLVEVLKPVGHCIVQAVTMVDARQGARTLRAALSLRLICKASTGQASLEL
jgi:hypothetical protein